MKRILLARLSFWLDQNKGRAASQAGSRIKHETTDLLATLETKVRPEMSEIMTFLEIVSAEKIAKIPFLASVM